MAPELKRFRLRRTCVRVAALLAAVALGNGCGDGEAPSAPPPPEPPRATTVAVTPATVELAALGATEQLSAEVRDQNGNVMTGAAVTWSSDNAPVAAVDASGLVTAAGNGTATITATAGAAAGTATVTVAQQVDAVAVFPAADTLVAGDTLRLAAEATDANGHAVDGTEFAWASSDTAVAVVDGKALVTGVAAGDVEITAMADEVTGTAMLAVLAPVPTTVEVAPDTAAFTAIGETAQLAAEVRDQIGNVMAGAAVTWSSGDASVATVDGSGLVTAVGNGTATITAAAGEASESATVTLAQQVTAVTVSPPADTLAVGDTLRLVAVATDSNGHPVARAEFDWTSSDTSVARVDDSGLVTGVAAGRVEVEAASSGVTGRSQITVPNRAPLALNSIPGLELTAGDTATLNVSGHFADPDGDELTFDAESSDEAVASVSVSGTAVTAAAVAMGTATITVNASDPAGLSARQTFDVEVRNPSSPMIADIDPPVLVEGETATISGSGFSPSPEENHVLVGGLPAPVLSSTATRLSVTVPSADCLPPREVVLRVSTAHGRDSVAIGATPLSGEEWNWPRFEWRHTSSGDGCIHLPGGTRRGEFVIGVTSTSEDPSRLTRVRLAGTPGDASIVSASQGPSVPRAGPVAYSRYAAPLVSSSGRIRPPPSVAGDRFQEVRGEAAALSAGWRAGHDDAMARNQALIAELGRAEWPAGPSAEVSARSSLAEGDTVTLDSGWGGRRVEAVVRLVGDHTVWLDDIANPAGTFTDAELKELDAFYSDHAKPVNDAYFGGLSDVDGNGRLLVLMTIDINRRGYGGLVEHCDLYPRSQCRISNEAEIFYAFVPDPDGVAGGAFSKEFVLRRYPSLLTHEVTHLVQGAARVFGEAPEKPSKWPWEWEGGATLAESLVGHRLLGHASGQDLGFREWNAARETFWYGWPWGLFEFFSRRHRGAPEECSWLTFKNRHGNDGPCGGDITYGVSQLVLRFAMDRWGGRYPGGERALLKRLTQSPRRGFASLVDVSPGWSVERILGEFYVTLWLEGTAGRATPGMTSWDIHDVVSRFNDSLWLRPYSSSSASPSVSARIRAGSSMYFRWTPTGRLRPTSFKVEPAGDDPVFIWAIRAR